MRTCAIAFLLVITSSANGLAWQRPQTPKLEDSVLTFYAGEFLRVVNVNQELFGKIYPFLQEFIQNRLEISGRRLDTLQQLKMLVQRPGSSDEDIKRAIQELDKADADMQANQERFLSNVDPLLRPRQQARVRMFQQVADQRMRQFLNSIRNPK